MAENTEVTHSKIFTFRIWPYSCAFQAISQSIKTHLRRGS